MPPPPVLPDEILEEILLRLPPDDPGCLFRASLVCKPWRSRLTSSGFSLLYRKFHRTPPLLGFFENDEKLFFWFAPLSPHSPSPFPLAHPRHCDLVVLDSRHGLVLLSKVGSSGEPLSLVVWDPVGSCNWDFPYPEFAVWESVPDSAAVLCATDGCDHLDCHGGPFRVVYVGTNEDDGIARACVYSSDARVWSPVTSCEHPEFSLEVVGTMPKALVGNALYFSCITSTIILRFDLTTQELAMVDPPQMYEWLHDRYILITMEDGVLGCASLQKSRINLWSMEAGHDGSVRWTLRRVVKLKGGLPSHSMTMINFADALGVFFATAHCGVFTVDIKSGQVKKVSSTTDFVIPYTSFYTPDQSGGITPPSTMGFSEEGIKASRDGHDDVLPLYSSGEESEEEDWEQEQEKVAQELFIKGSMAIEKGQFVDAKYYFREVLVTRELLHGRLSPKCLSTYFKYGCALLYAQPKSAQKQDFLKYTTNSHGTGKELDLAWKMLLIAKAILENAPCSPLEKLEIFSALAEVSMEREDIDCSLSAWFKALAILEHLVQPDDIQIILLNLRIFWTFESASKIGDAIAYREKATALCKSRIQNLKKANEALLADNGGNASAAEFGSVKSCPDKRIKYLTPSLTILGKQLERLEQAVSTWISKASDQQTVGTDVPRVTSSTPSQIAVRSNEMFSTEISGSAGST
uniref:Uncharacterized protein n=1 Tax=Avena sativa TaxID=4498 RepID=A0ACD5UZZ9_AVESA